MVISENQLIHGPSAVMTQCEKSEMGGIRCTTAPMLQTEPCTEEGVRNTVGRISKAWGLGGEDGRTEDER